MKFTKAFSGFLLLLLAACGERDMIAPVVEPDYFPLEIGNYWVYEVEETTYSLLEVVTSNYELRETLVDTIEGESPTYLMLQERRANEGEEWEADSMFTVRKTSTALIVTENNLAYARMAFPVERGKEWNGNAYNALPEAEYEYVEVSTILSELEFGTLVQVQLSDIEQNLVNQDEQYQIYAEGVGLIEKNYIRFNFVTSGENLGEIESGRVLKQYLKEYEKN